ncbi:MAG: HypC/HybG/HupF family hydrogenase formation chaperone [Deltaproteobacteria bacterium]|nr:HypC/HybG/HupF family hydrogenase formation chaperone [Deltaproteobacteria bacterium]
MCLAIPARVVAVEEGDDPLARTGTVDLQGSRISVGLALVPDAGLGAWVLVHAGYAIEHLDEDEAKETWRWLRDAKLVEGELPKAEPKGSNLINSKEHEERAPEAAS